jgi:ribokinase
MAAILVAGALHLDVVVTAPRLPLPDETLPGTSVAYPFGGKGGNQALAAARMGARAAMAGRVGSDDFGDRLLAALDRGRVNREQVRRVPGPSGMSVAIVTADGGYGAVIVSGVNAGIDPGEIAVPAGTRLLLLQNEIPEPANLALARKARAAGARVILNAAPARPVGEALLALADILIVNRVEADQMTGARGLAPADAAAALRLGGARTVIVTLGADGAILSEPGRSIVAEPAFAVARVVSSHGAGDTFIGAFAAELATGATPQAALRFGQAAAALAVATPPEERDRIGPAEVRERIAAG